MSGLQEEGEHDRARVWIKKMFGYINNMRDNYKGDSLRSVVIDLPPKAEPGDQIEFVAVTALDASDPKHRTTYETTVPPLGGSRRMTVNVAVPNEFPASFFDIVEMHVKRGGDIINSSYNTFIPTEGLTELIALPF